MGSSKKSTRGIVDQSHREGEALFLAAGEFAVKGVALFVEAKAFQKFFGIAAAGVEAGEKFEGFEGFEFVGEGSGLKGGADFVV